MPLKPPQFLSPLRFDPVYLTDEDVDDLASFTGMTPDACRRRVREYSSQELARAWEKANPKSADDILAFYRSNDLYLWELAQWHASDARRQYWQALTHLVQHYRPEDGWRRVYEFGCGIATDSLFLAMSGYDVTMADVDAQAFRFAQHRFHKRNIPGTFIESRSPLPDPTGSYDVVVCFDVFEHLPDPLAAAKRLVGALRDGGVLLQVATFSGSDEHGYHLAEGIRRFGGLKWDICLSRLGLKRVSPLVYRKERVRPDVLLRYALWNTTGVWMMRL